MPRKLENNRHVLKKSQETQPHGSFFVKRKNQPAHIKCGKKNENLTQPFIGPVLFNLVRISLQQSEEKTWVQ